MSEPGITKYVTVQRLYEHPVQRVWLLLSNFSEMPWNGLYSEAVQVEGAGVGMIRRIFLPSHEEPVVERLDLLDHRERRMHFSIIGGIAAPVSDFRVALQVSPCGDKDCQAQVDVQFELALGSNPDDMVYIVRYSYEEALQRLEDYLASRFR